MLQLIYGRAGSGKTEYIRKQAEESLQKFPERPVFYLVPEQFSFETERAMLYRLGPKDAPKVSVLSFSRLADEVFRRYGGAAGRRLEDGGRYIYMSLALEQVKEQLEFYRKKAETTEIVGMLLAISQELKLCAVSPDAMRKASERLPEGTLRTKTRELALILEAYDALVSENCVDPLDDLSRILDLLLVHRFFQGALVLLDSFTSFTVQEYGVLRIMLEQAGCVAVTLCADSPRDEEQGAGLFSLVQRTGSRLKRIARENEISVAAPVVLSSGARFASEELKALENSAYRPRKERIPEGRTVCDAVLYRAADLYEEAEFAAATIRNLVMEKGYRYRDFAVIARDTGPYTVLLEEAFSARDIPVFLDDPRPVEGEPLMRLVLSALQAVRSGWKTENLLLLLKTGLTPLPAESVAQLENYTYTWSIQGKEWRSVWDRHPRGFQPEWTQKDRELLLALERDRRVLTEPLERLRKTLQTGSGEECAAAVYQLLETWKVAARVREMAAELESMERGELSERLIRSWDVLMGALDQCALVMGNFVPGCSRFSELLRLVISSGTLASIPQGLDQVTVSAADRMRLANPKVVFLLGARQGEFPASLRGEGMFSGLERRELIELGIPLNETLEGNALQERFLAYTALSSASDRIYISYALGNGDGRGAPSSLVSETEAILPSVPHWSSETLPVDYMANSEAAAFRAVARNWKKGTVTSATLETCFWEKDGYKEKLGALDRAASRVSASFREPEKAAALFGSRMELSPTQIETFHLCRFQYFCRFGLGVKEQRAAEMNALEYGSVMHFLLERSFRDMGAEKICAMDSEERERMIQNLLEQYTEERLGGRKDKTSRFLWMLERLVRSASVIVAHIAEELMQSEFVPVDFELEVGEAVPPLEIPLPDGSAAVRGKIDRVDLFERNGRRFIRVIDYKTGTKEFRLSDVVYGVNMQMLIYLAALSESGNSRYGDGCLPAGILYMPAVDPRISAGRSDSAEKTEAARNKALRMKGLLVDDPVLLTAMEAQGEGRYIPVALKNGVPSRRESVVTEKEMEKILERVRRTIACMGMELRAGHVEARPLEGGSYNACEWCPYGAVCGHEEGMQERNMEKWDRDALLLELCGKEE